MKAKICECVQGRVYRGTFEVGKKKLFWLLIFTVAMPDMNKEVEARQKRGQDVQNPEVLDELFKLIVLDQNWQEVQSRDLLAKFVEMAIIFHDMK